MIDDVYNGKILEFAGNIERIGRLENPTASAKAHSKLCGSTIIVDILVEDGVVTDYAHEVKACALGQASTMLKDNGPPPNGKFDDFKYLEPVRDYKARHASTLLAFDAIVDAFEQCECA